jgi:hypothetical protein
MKSLIHTVTIAALLSAPVLVFAQENGPVTRAQVKAGLTQLEQAGYSPGSDQPDYPANLQAAEARVNNQADHGANTAGYGGTVSHSSQWGARAALPGDRNSIYFGD